MSLLLSSCVPNSVFVLAFTSVLAPLVSFFHFWLAEALAAPEPEAPAEALPAPEPEAPAGELAAPEPEASADELGG